MLCLTKLGNSTTITTTFVYMSTTRFCKSFYDKRKKYLYRYIYIYHYVRI